MYSQCCWVIPFYRPVLLRYVSLDSHFFLLLHLTISCRRYKGRREDERWLRTWQAGTGSLQPPPAQLVMPEDNGKRRHKARFYTAFLKCCYTPTCYSLWLHSCSEFKQFSVGVLFNGYFRADGIDLALSYISLMAKHHDLVKCLCQSRNL